MQRYNTTCSGPNTLRKSLQSQFYSWHDTSKYQESTQTSQSTNTSYSYQTPVRIRSSAWSLWLKQDILELEKVQCCAVRFVHNNYWSLASVTQMTSALGWETLEARRQKARLCMLFKTINGIIKVPFDHYKLQTPTTISTRYSHDTNLSIPPPRTNVYKYFFFPKTIRRWNYLPTQAVTSTHLHTFITALSTILAN